MTRIALVFAGLLAVSSSVFAQTPDIDTPVLALPANLREGATVIKWKKDYTYDTLKKGTNTLVCYDRSGYPLQQPFSIECTDLANLERAAQNLKGEAIGDRAKANAAFDEMEKAGTRAKPKFGSVWYHLNGKDKDSARPHMTIAVPMATTASMGLPDNNKAGGVWIMNAGTTTAHLMVPGE